MKERVKRMNFGDWSEVMWKRFREFLAITFKHERSSFKKMKILDLQNF